MSNIIVKAQTQKIIVSPPGQTRIVVNPPMDKVNIVEAGNVTVPNLGITVFPQSHRMIVQGSENKPVIVKPAISSVSIINAGPMGPAGPQGIQGIQGPAGADGQDGVDGSSIQWQDEGNNLGAPDAMTVNFVGAPITATTLILSGWACRCRCLRMPRRSCLA